MKKVFDRWGHVYVVDDEREGEVLIKDLSSGRIYKGERLTLSLGKPMLLQAWDATGRINVLLTGEVRRIEKISLPAPPKAKPPGRSGAT